MGAGTSSTKRTTTTAASSPSTTATTAANPAMLPRRPGRENWALFMPTDAAAASSESSSSTSSSRHSLITAAGDAARATRLQARMDDSVMNAADNPWHTYTSLVAMLRPLVDGSPSTCMTESQLLQLHQLLTQFLEPSSSSSSSASSSSSSSSSSSTMITVEQRRALVNYPCFPLRMINNSYHNESAPLLHIAIMAVSQLKTPISDGSNDVIALITSLLDWGASVEQRTPYLQLSPMECLWYTYNDDTNYHYLSTRGGSQSSASSGSGAENHNRPWTPLRERVFDLLCNHNVDLDATCERFPLPLLFMRPSLAGRLIGRGSSPYYTIRLSSMTTARNADGKRASISSSGSGRLSGIASPVASVKTTMATNLPRVSPSSLPPVALLDDDGFPPLPSYHLVTIWEHYRTNSHTRYWSPHHQHAKISQLEDSVRWAREQVTTALLDVYATMYRDITPVIIDYLFPSWQPDDSLLQAMAA